jgi:hypothetical protein
MSRPDELPEDAVFPPRIVTPEEDADRAQLRLEREERRAVQGVPSDPADALDPLRMPGEMASPPGWRTGAP